MRYSLLVTRCRAGLAIFIILASAGLNGHTSAQLLLNRLTPVAFDESVKVVSAGEAEPIGTSAISKPSIDWAVDADGGTAELHSILSDREASMGSLDIPAVHSGQANVSLNRAVSEDPDYSTMNVSDTLLPIPKRETPALTKLITGKEAPTFVSRDLVKPTLEKNETDGTILVRYKLLIPIFIPSIKLNEDFNLTGSSAVKYTKESDTKLVPMTKNMPKVKTIYKAERVPQKVITDYVIPAGGQLPRNVDDKLHPDEKVVQSVVTNAV